MRCWVNVQNTWFNPELQVEKFDELVAEKHMQSSFYRRLVSLVGKIPVYPAGGSGSIPDRTITQGLKN